MTAFTTGHVLPIGTSWWQLLVDRATATPDKVQLADEHDRQLTFGTFVRLAEEVAAGLQHLGMKSSHVVSWQLPTSIEAAVLMAALSRLGVRQNPIVPILRQAEVSLITAQLASDWMIVPGVVRGFDFTAMAQDSVPATCRVLSTDAFAADIELSLPRADPSILAPAVIPAADDVRWYFYSSGTTAAPKGAKHSDFSAMSSSNAQITYTQVHGDDVFPVPFPIAHIGGIMLLTSHTRTGGQLCMMDPFDPVSTPVTMAEMGATLLGSATPFFNAYVAAQRRHGDTPLFPKLRQLQAGGAPILPDLVDECERVLGCLILNQWGLTEFPAVTSLSPSDPPVMFRGSVGRIAPGVDLKAVDSEGNETAPGVEGELLGRGPQRCLGYVDSSLDAAAFDDDGYFRTGDLGTIDADGFVRITGRLKDVIIRNAENISALEVETVLIRHAAIADVAVIGLPDARTGERACAVIVLANPASTPPTLSELAAHCANAGLSRQKTPEQLEVASALPRNLMGKVLKHVLRSQYAPEPGLATRR